MSLNFRNLNVTPDDPVQDWGPEGILTAIERGGLSDWRRIVRAVERDPHGPVADDLAEALVVADSPGVAAALRRVLDLARDGDRAVVADRVRAAVRRSGLTAAEFAAVLGTSASRLSTYMTGKAVPSAVLMERIEREGRDRARL